MQISGMGARASSCLLQQKRVGGQAQQFANLISVTAATAVDKAGGVSQTQAVGAGASKPDFRSMTPAQFRAEVKGMYDRGEIGADTLFSGVTLRTYSQDEISYGSVGGGKFDYVAIFQDAKRFAASHAGRYDSEAEVKNYVTILSMLNR